MLRRLTRGHFHLRRLQTEWRFTSASGSIASPQRPQSTGYQPPSTRTLHTVNKSVLGTRASFAFNSSWRRFATALQQEKNEDDDTESVDRSRRGPAQRMRRLLRDGHYDAVLEVFEEAKKGSGQLDSRIYTAAMKSCSRHGDYKKVAELFEEMRANNVTPDKFTFNTYLYSFTITGDIKGAEKAFEMMKDEFNIPADDVTYRSMIVVAGSGGDLKKAESYFKKVTEEFGKHERNYNCLIDAYASSVTPENGEAYYKKAKKIIETLEADGLKTDDHTYARLVELCCRAGMISEAMTVLEEMKGKDLVLRLAQIDSIATAIGDSDKTDEEVSTELKKLLKYIPGQRQKPTELTYENLLNLFSKRGNLRKALDFMDELVEQGFTKNGMFYGAKLRCIERLGEEGSIDPKESLKMLSEVTSQFENTTIVPGQTGYKSWLNIASKASDIDALNRCWESIKSARSPSRDVMRSLINVYLKHDEVDQAVSVFQYMIDNKKQHLLTTFQLMFEYLKDNNDKERLSKIYKMAKDASVTLDEETKKYLESIETD